MKRKIAAILAADVAGYSRLVADDEEQTLTRLASYRQVFEDFVSRAGGRIFNTAGDAVLAEFPSAVEAVRCAIDIQESMRTRNLAYPQHRRMDFRMGLTIGDVVERDGDLLGDGVNIAARLEGLAEPGGICISQSVHEAVANKVGVDFRDIGAQEVKNIPRPVHAFLIGPRPMPARNTVLAPKVASAPHAPSRAPLLAGVAALALLAAGAGWWLLRGGDNEPVRSIARTTPDAPPAPVTVARNPEVTPTTPATQQSSPQAQTPAPAPLPADPVEALRALAERGGIVNDPKSAPEFYHNARSYETRGDAVNARRAYLSFAALRLNVLDPLLRLASLLRVQEGRAGARETLTELAASHPTPASRLVHAMQFDGEDRRVRLEKFIADNPGFGPAYYLLSQEFGEDRLGAPPTIADRRKELEHLASFLKADREGGLQPYFMDHSVLGDWLDKARKRFASLNDTNSAKRDEPSLTYMRHNGGWTVTVQPQEAALEIAYRIGEAGEFKPTPLMTHIDRRTGKPFPSPNFELPPDLEKADIHIRYKDAAGAVVGPFVSPFYWRAMLASGQRQILQQFQNSWVAFRNEALYENLLYFTHLVSYRCAIQSAEVRLDDDREAIKLPLPDCNIKDPFAIPANMQPYIRMRPGVKAATIDLTYIDGVRSDPVTIGR